MNLSIECSIMNHRKSKFFFSIRNKLDYISLILNCVEDFLNRESSKVNKYEKIIIITGKKFKRVYFLSLNKIFSVFFPFDFIENDDRVEFTYALNGNIYKITYLELSCVRTIIETLKEIDNGKNTEDEGVGIYFSSIFDELCELESEYNVASQIGTILYGLLSSEDGYIRYDNDEINQGSNHPRHHLDIFYDDRTTYKIGLTKQFSATDMIELLDNSCERKYLNVD